MLYYSYKKKKVMKLVLTDEMLNLTLQHQNRSLYFEKFEELVRKTYPEWTNASKNEIFKKFEAVYNREDKITDLTRERESYIRLMKEQYHVSTFDKELNKKQSKRNYNYWASRIKRIDEDLIELGYNPSNPPTYDSIKFSNSLNSLGLLLALGLIIYTVYIIFK